MIEMIASKLTEKFPQPFPFHAVDAFVDDEDITRLYDETIEKIQGGLHDVLLKRMRYFILHQAVAEALRRNPALELAECGCWMGHSTAIIATLMARQGAKGRLHVFDAFEGGLSRFHDLDKARIKDESQIARLTEHFRSDEQAVRRSLAEFSSIDFYPGWIPERFAEVDDKLFGFVSLDVDLYEPTLQSIEYFWPRLTGGGVMFFDDFGTTTFPGARVAVEGYLADRQPAFFLRMPFGSAIAIK